MTLPSFPFVLAWGLGLLLTAGLRAAPESRPEAGEYQLEANIPFYEPDMPRQGDSAYINERCRLDVYHPPIGQPVPTVLFFHGGGLTQGGKQIPEVLKNSRLIVVAPNYRLSSDRARCPDYLYDAAAAATWVFRHIREFGGDPDQVYVSGHSAGGWLAAMISMAPQYLEKFGQSNRRFAAVMPISGQMTTHFQILNERTGASGMKPPDRAVIDEFAPLYHAVKDLPPIILYTGDPKIEWPARAEENALLAATLVRIARHSDTQLFTLPGFDHGSVVAPALLLMKKRIAADATEKAKK